MDPTTTFCPNLQCPARGHVGASNIRIHSRKDQRFLCTAFYRLCTAAETVTLMVTLLAHSCLPQAIVAAFGFVVGRGSQRTARHDADPATDRAGPPLCRAPSAVGLYRWFGQLYPGDSRNLSRSHAYGHRWAAPAASMAPWLHCPSRQALHHAVHPPSTTKLCPVQCAEAVEAR
jgi:hypothetical protein